MWNLERALVEICRPAARLAAALGRLARRARRAAADPRLPRGPRRAADQGAHPRHRPRHQPGDRDDGRLRGGQGGDRRARRGRPRRPAGEGRRRGRLPDADQPEHARALRREHRRDRLDRPRRRRDALLRRRQPERDHGLHAAGRHGLRHRPPQPAQVVQPAARGRGPGRRPDRGLGPDRAVPAGAADRPRRDGQRRRAELRPRPRGAEVDRPPARLPGQLRRLRALLRLHLEPRRRRAARGVGDRGPERQLPAGAAARGAGRQVPAARLRAHADARVRALGQRRPSASSR